MTDADDGTISYGGWTIYPPGEEEPDDFGLDERMRENVRKSGSTSQGFLLLGLLALLVRRLVADRELDRGLLGLFLLGLGIDLGLQLYYQYEQRP
jgi:hypothetical protein